jgi:ketosteroid isomerase-like protein
MRIKALLAVLFVACTAFGQAEEPPKPADTSKEMFNELAEKDRMLFDAVFNTCDLKALANLVTEDFEFYHDKGGLTATSREQFVQSIGAWCERRKAGLDHQSKRVLDEGSLAVYPLNNYGAIQVGVHRFYAIREGKLEGGEVAKFTHVWKKESDGWRVARVLSYDHKPGK